MPTTNPYSPLPGPYVGPTTSSTPSITPGVATSTAPPPNPIIIPTTPHIDVSSNSIPGNVPSSGNTINTGGTSANIPSGSASNSISNSTVAGNITISTVDPAVIVKPAGFNGQIQYNYNSQFSASANLAWAQNGLFVGGVPTSLDATGIITASKEVRVGVWSGFDGSTTDAWGRFRIANAYSSNTFYGFSGDPDITNPNKTVVITNEEQDVHQAMILMDGVAYNTLSPNSEGTIFGVSVNQTNANYRPSTGFESGWKKIINVTNKGNVKIGGSLVISPSYQITPPANNTVGIYFADGTFQYTAASGGSSTITIKDEGTNVVASANTINFVGSGVTASNVGGVATITIPGSSGISGIAVQEEGTNVVATANTVNFVGTGVTASNVGGVATVTVNTTNINTVYDAGSNITVTLNYNNGQWQNYAPSGGTVDITISNIPTGGEMTIFFQTGSTSTAITWHGPTVFFWEGGDDQPSTSSGTRDVVTIKNNGGYYFAKFSKDYTT